MRRRKRLVGVALTSAALTLALAAPLTPSPGMAATNASLLKTATSLVAAAHNLSPADLKLVSVNVGRWPLTHKTVVTFKLRDRSGQPYQILLDRGRQTDLETLDAAEERAFFERYGRLDPLLHEHIQGLGEDAEVPVALWLNEPTYQKPPRHAPHSEPSEADVDRAAITADAQRSAFIASLTGPVVDSLNRLGASSEADSFAPLITTTLTVADLRAVDQWEAVQRIYLAQNAQSHLNHARPAIRADLVHALGFTGGTTDNQIRIAQIEAEGGRVAGHTNLAAIVQDFTYVCLDPSLHATRVAGVMKSSEASRKGIAPSSILRAAGSCTGNESQLNNRATAAADWGARALNLSWGNDAYLAPGYLDKFYDSMVVNRYRSIIVAAGNEASPCNSHGRITSPGMGYGVVTVGAFDDKNSADWATDSMYPCSSYVDPDSTYEDREKPDIVAPGFAIQTTGISNNFVEEEGTSLAAPMVTGTAALLMQRDPSLKEWPAGLRAVLIATAFNNITGFQQLSDRDGAGGIDARRAYDAALVANRSGWNGIDNYTCSSENPITRTVFFQANRRTRVAVAWDNDPAWSSYSSRPSVDFDLEVLAPGGTPVADSTSNDNSFEVVDFTTVVEGNYTLRMTRYNCSYPPWVVAWAWSNAAGPS